MAQKQRLLLLMHEMLVSIPASGRSPGERNGTHSSIIAWEILWTEESGRLQFMGSQRHKLVSKQQETRNSHKHVNIPFWSFYRGRKPTMRLELKQHPYTLHSSTSFSSLHYLNQAQNLCQFSELLVFSISGQCEYLLPNLKLKCH